MRTDSYLNDSLLRSAFQGMSKLYKYLKILATEFFFLKKENLNHRGTAVTSGNHIFVEHLLDLRNF